MNRVDNENLKNPFLQFVSDVTRNRNYKLEVKGWINKPLFQTYY